MADTSGIALKVDKIETSLNLLNDGQPEGSKAAKKRKVKSKAPAVVQEQQQEAQQQKQEHDFDRAKEEIDANHVNELYAKYVNELYAQQQQEQQPAPQMGWGWYAMRLAVGTVFALGGIQLVDNLWAAL